MGPEIEKSLIDLDGQSSRFFLDFMTGVTKFEELVNVGQQFLVGFYRELEIFRRPELDKKSDVVDAIIKSIHTDRMNAYIEAGCMRPHLAIQNIIKLQSCKQGLLEHLKQVNVMLHDLECLKENVIGIAQQVNQSALDMLDIRFGDGRTQLFSEEEEKEPLIKDKSISHAIIVAAVLGMLKLDFAMQENIIKALNPNTSSSELENYCMMWDLRPYIYDNVMRQAWRFVPR